MLKAKDVRTDEITDAMLGRAHKIICATGNFYKVSSSRDETIEYSVRYDARKGFTCGCEAGLRGFSNCKDGCCAHVKIAVACENEVKAALRELEAAIVEQSAPVAPAIVTNVDAETLARVLAACEKPRKVSKVKAPVYRGFSMMR